MPYSRSHACLPCDLLCAHIAALRSKKSVSIPPCGKCSVNLSRLRQLSGHKFFFMTPRHKIYWQIFIKNLSSDFCIQKNMRYLMYACYWNNHNFISLQNEIIVLLYHLKLVLLFPYIRLSPVPWSEPINSWHKYIICHSKQMVYGKNNIFLAKKHHDILVMFFSCHILHFLRQIMHITNHFL